MKSKSVHSTMRLLWVSDIHLDRAEATGKERFLELLAAVGNEGIVITGDISRAASVVQHLGEIAAACPMKPVFFTLGNHDFFGSSIHQIESAVDAACREFANLHHLGKGEVIPLGQGTALIGHRGWCDGRAGFWEPARVPSPDRHAISEFRGLSNDAYYERVRNLGRESADYIRTTLPGALSRYRRVIIATHFPPHTEAVQFDDRQIRWERMGNFSNYAMGGALVGIARSFPGRGITVLSGHSHCAATVRVAPGVEVRVAGARTGKPGVQGVIDVARL